MGFKRCPGSMAFTQPKIELVRCSHCGGDAEVWSDEAEGKCTACGHSVCRTARQSCIDWCKYARECIGDEAHKRYQDLKTRLRKETLFKALERQVMDQSRVDDARLAVTFAEKILSHEPGADPNIVIAAAVLRTVCLSDPAGDAQPVPMAPEDNEHLSVVADILHELAYPEGFIKEVCSILQHLGDSDVADTINARVVHDADLLARGAERKCPAAPPGSGGKGCGPRNIPRGPR